MLLNLRSSNSKCKCSISGIRDGNPFCFDHSPPLFSNFYRSFPFFAKYWTLIKKLHRLLQFHSRNENHPAILVRQSATAGSHRSVSGAGRLLPEAHGQGFIVAVSGCVGANVPHAKLPSVCANGMHQLYGQNSAGDRQGKFSDFNWLISKTSNYSV